MNQRTGRFARTPEPPGPWPPARRVLADNLNNDGHPDVLLLAEDHALVIFGQAAGRQRLELGQIKPAAVTLLDYDNDGWLDVCIGGSRRDAPDRGAIRIVAQHRVGRLDQRHRRGGPRRFGLAPRPRSHSR